MSRRGLARLDARRDANEREIVNALTAMGIHVTRINGKGVPDLLLSAQQRQWIAEVKTKQGKPTPDQIAFKVSWRGSEIPTFRSVDDALSWAREFGPLGPRQNREV